MTQSKQNTPDLPDALEALGRLREFACKYVQPHNANEVTDWGEIVRLELSHRAAEAVGGDKAVDLHSVLVPHNLSLEERQEISDRMKAYHAQRKGLVTDVEMVGAAHETMVQVVTQESQPTFKKSGCDFGDTVVCKFLNGWKYTGTSDNYTEEDRELIFKACDQYDKAAQPSNGAGLEKVREALEYGRDFFAGSHESGHDYRQAQFIEALAELSRQQSALRVGVDAKEVVTDEQLDAMISEYEKERHQYLGKVIYHANNQECFRSGMRKALALLSQAQPDLSKCPGCGGPADNGHDRCVPPTPYYCTKCDAAPTADRAEALKLFDEMVVRYKIHGSFEDEEIQCVRSFLSAPTEWRPIAEASKLNGAKADLWCGEYGRATDCVYFPHGLDGEGWYKDGKNRINPAVITHYREIPAAPSEAGGDAQGLVIKKGGE